jgi:thioredoxin-related protein
MYKDIFKKKFMLNATPATIFFDRDGNQMEEEVSYGYQGAEDFFNKIELLAEPF